MLQTEVDTLEEERKEVELHLNRTESWSEHLGKWRCHVKGVEHVEGDKENYLKAHLIIYVPFKKSFDDSTGKIELPEAHSKTSWSCIRKVKFTNI